MRLPARPPLVLTCALIALACDPEPVPVRPPAARTGSAPAITLSVAPEEAGISDVARVSRYVYREMNTRPECEPVALPNGRYQYAYDVVVARGRVTEARLTGVARLGPSGAQALVRVEWPVALEKALTCLLPHLRRVQLTPTPADGVYVTRFVAGADPS